MLLASSAGLRSGFRIPRLNAQILSYSEATPRVCLHSVTLREAGHREGGCWGGGWGGGERRGTRGGHSEVEG
jgi:hypothetical protein